MYLLRGERSGKNLGEWKTWMAAHNAAIVLLLLVLGAKYIGDAITGLTA